MHSPSDPFSPTNGWWLPAADSKPDDGRYALEAALLRVKKPLYLIEKDGQLAASHSGQAVIPSSPGAAQAPQESYPLRAYAAPLPPEQLGSRIFRQRHGLRYAYVMGAMANGITSVSYTHLRAHETS